MTNPNHRMRGNAPELRLHLECNFAAVRRGATQLRTYLTSHGVGEKEIWACELAFVEGCNNAIQHTPRVHSDKKILVELALRSGEFELRINEFSTGCDFPVEPTLPADDSESGRGIFLMRTLMDDVVYIRRDACNCLVLKKALTGI